MTTWLQEQDELQALKDRIDKLETEVRVYKRAAARLADALARELLAH